jgi:hypothetical protein
LDGVDCPHSAQDRHQRKAVLSTPAILRFCKMLIIVSTWTNISFWKLGELHGMKLVSWTRAINKAVCITLERLSVSAAVDTGTGERREPFQTWRAPSARLIISLQGKSGTKHAEDEGTSSKQCLWERRHPLQRRSIISDAWYVSPVHEYCPGSQQYSLAWVTAFITLREV